MDYSLRFYGKGSTYFGIVAINFILTALTLGLYYPWAKAKFRNYIWNETEFRGSRFVFHGTGNEMFKGFVIAYIMLITFYLLYFSILTNVDSSPTWVVISFVFFMFINIFWFIPFALFSSWRYRMSRTSWRGIYFSFIGNFSEYYKVYLKFLLITILTLGIGMPWLRVGIQRYLMGYTQLGDLEIDFHGDGGTLLGINILGGILLYPTLFMYVPFFLKNRFNFTINNTTLSDGRIQRALQSHLKGWDFFGVLIGNFFMLLFTLGLAFPFARMRTLRAMAESVELPFEIDYDNITQDADSFNQATGDELLDILDIDIDF